MITTITFPRKVFEEMIAHGNSDLRNEVCGGGLGKNLPDDPHNVRIDQFVPITNVAAKDEFNDGPGLKTIHGDRADYIPESSEFFRFISKTTHYKKEAPYTLGCIFHTHPGNRPKPSIYDVGGAGYETVYVIYSPCYQEINAYFWESRAKVFIPIQIKITET